MYVNPRSGAAGASDGVEAERAQVDAALPHLRRSEEVSPRSDQDASARIGMQRAPNHADAGSETPAEAQSLVPDSQSVQLQEAPVNGRLSLYFFCIFLYTCIYTFYVRARK